MATPILRKIDRWRFETPLGLALAAAAGFAVMAMPHPLFARIPTLGGYGRPGQIGLALLAALVCGGLGYVAMRRPAKRVAVAEDEDYIEDLHAPVDLPVAAAIEDEPLRLRRADRHPDAPPRAPIRASRDLGEPFMEVGTPTTPGVEEAFAAHAPVETDDHGPAAFETGHDIAAESVEAVVAEHEAAEHEPVAEPVAEEAVEHSADAVVEPVAADAAADAVVEPVAADAAADAVVEPVADETPSTIEAPLADAPRPLPTPSREDTSIAAMMERLSAGLQRRSEAVGRPIGAARQNGPALRDALDELNRLAARRG